MTPATLALLAELDLTPKPGLVDREHRGAHRDMDAERMEAGARALDDTFAALARIGCEARVASRELREEMGSLARAGERAMLRATGGINTHRGAYATQSPRYRRRANDATALDRRARAFTCRLGCVNAHARSRSTRARVDC